MLQMKSVSSSRATQSSRTTQSSLSSTTRRDVTTRIWGSKKESQAPTAKGIRYDPNMQRWVKDTRVGEVKDVTCKPLTGSEYTIWPVCHAVLVEKGLRSVSPEEAFKLQSKGWKIVDVRIIGDFEKEAADGAISLPMYRTVEGDGQWDKIKRFVMASFAMTATERDPDYAGTAASYFKKKEKIIIMCAIGGTLKTGVNLRPDKYPNGIQDPDRDFGRESRSLKAAYELMTLGGWTKDNLMVVEGGLQQWRFQGYPMRDD